MAYLLGIVTEAEAEILKKRGWDLGEVDDDLYEELSRTHELTNGTSDRFVAVFVDNNLSDIMSGPDWDRGDRA